MGVVGSIPAVSANFYGPLAQLARASDLHSEGRGFDSHRVHYWVIV